ESSDSERQGLTEELPTKKKASAERGTPRRRKSASSRQVVAERGPDHVVDGLGRDVDRAVVAARPAILLEVGVGQSPANAALRTLIDAMPESNRSFLNEADVAGAGAAAGRCELIGR